MNIKNCNNCLNIDYTEQEQHKYGAQIIPGHYCTYYKTRLLHEDRHNGNNNCIFPCKRCINDNHKQFRSRE